MNYNDILSFLTESANDIFNEVMVLQKPHITENIKKINGNLCILSHNGDEELQAVSQGVQDLLCNISAIIITKGKNKDDDALLLKYLFWQRLHQSGISIYNRHSDIYQDMSNKSLTAWKLEFSIPLYF